MPELAFYTRASGSAIRQIATFGRAMVLQVPTLAGPSRNRITTWTPEPIIALSLGYEIKEIDGQIVQVDDRRVLVAHTGTRISAAMRITDGGIDYPIVNVSELSPGDSTILYTLQLRL